MKTIKSSSTIKGPVIENNSDAFHVLHYANIYKRLIITSPKIELNKLILITETPMFTPRHN
jgi:hypothetical protein